MSPAVRMVYAATLLVAVVTAWWLTHRKQRVLQLTTKQRLTIGIAAFFGAAIGSKVPFLAEQGWDGLFQGTAWFADGKTILGGIVGGYIAVEFAKWIADIRIRTGDSFAVPVAIAICVGRLGCFIAGCCHGQITEVPWGIDFGLLTDPPATLRHPTQLYEMIFHVISAFALLWCDRHRWLIGNQLKAYLIAYFLFRFITEWLRPETPVLWNLTLYQLASVALIALLTALWMAQNDRVREHL